MLKPRASGVSLERDRPTQKGSASIHLIRQNNHTTAGRTRLIVSDSYWPILLKN